MPYYNLVDACTWFRSVVVVTSALHAEGPGFEPRRNLKIYFYFTQMPIYTIFIQSVFKSNYHIVKNVPRKFMNISFSYF